MLKNYLTYIKEQANHELDPYGEDDWEEHKIVGYFIIDDRTKMHNEKYIQDFLKKNKPEIHKKMTSAIRELAFKTHKNGEYDASYYNYCVVVLYENGKVELARR